MNILEQAKYITTNTVCEHDSTHIELADHVDGEHTFPVVICDFCGTTIGTYEGEDY